MEKSCETTCSRGYEFAGRPPTRAVWIFHPAKNTAAPRAPTHRALVPREKRGVKQDLAGLVWKGNLAEVYRIRPVSAGASLLAFVAGQRKLLRQLAPRGISPRANSADPAPPTNNPQDLWRSGCSIFMRNLSALLSQTPHAVGNGQQGACEKADNPILATATGIGSRRCRPARPRLVRVDPESRVETGDQTPSSPVPFVGRIGGSGWKTLPDSTGPRHNHPRCFQAHWRKSTPSGILPPRLKWKIAPTVPRTTSRRQCGHQGASGESLALPKPREQADTRLNNRHGDEQRARWEDKWR